MQLLKDAMDAIMEWGGGTKKKKRNHWQKEKVRHYLK